ncbi:CrcB family protein [Nocardioides sp. zg-536]|uniref:Fluoride-specific ion channel FluC n=1 Tax=Nocardioides faecalis TaxID=2803858 RepID=A0A938Y510_9ACTN|nr:CrcB family protein [Nocardioides faecalis]MBM9460143.1 CrcB family protein [Nocardioides faecalis]MBS4754241.1 CrcB family protein [Nocardioides faecalis]QVI60062.1 CrcB family protein [Nocardioides faecalis]
MRPAYLRGASIGLVLLGGAVGVAAREGLVLAIPNRDGIPIVVQVVNVLGAFVLGYLYEALTHTRFGSESVSRIKLLVGTGFCGGLTTYSSLATDTAVLLDDSRVGVALAYALSTVVVGGAATVLGIVLGGRRHAPAGGSR